MRNNFEHFDERLDRWWQQSTNHNRIDLSVGPKHMMPEFPDIEQFRAFDPVTTELAFWGQTFNIQEIVNEVHKIGPKLLGPVFS